MIEVSEILWNSNSYNAYYAFYFYINEMKTKRWRQTPLSRTQNSKNLSIAKRRETRPMKAESHLNKITK
jgi:hypothetical protein